MATASYLLLFLASYVLTLSVPPCLRGFVVKAVIGCWLLICVNPAVNKNQILSADSFDPSFQQPTPLLRQPVLLQPTGGFVWDGVFQQPFLETGIDMVLT